MPRAEGVHCSVAYFQDESEFFNADDDNEWLSDDDYGLYG